MRDIVLKALNKPYMHYVSDIKNLTKLNREDIINTLEELKNDKLVYQKDDCFYLMKEGKIQIKDSGFGFISVEGEASDYHVSEVNTKNAFDGDIVSFYVLPSISKDLSDSAVVIDIIKRKNTHVYGKFYKKVKKGVTECFVKSFDPHFNVKCYIKPKDLKEELNDGDIVSAKIDKYVNQNRVEGKIEEIFGDPSKPGLDITLIAAKYGFHVEFPKEVMDEASLIDDKVDLSKYQTRKDFRDKIIITIDGTDSKDFDDAISVERTPNGNYLLGVYIADVAEYVKDGTALDKEAYLRGTSSYLADRVIPMLPKKLSNGICSLNEGEDRLVLACIMEIDLKGNLVNYYITEGIIKSRHRMTYDDVNKLLYGDLELRDKYLDIYYMLKSSKELADIIREKRTKKGAIEFDTPEYKITLDEFGNPVDFIRRKRDIAEMLIEDFMLMANETVAYHLSISNLPGIFRVHEKPAIDRVKAVYDLMNNLGISVRMPKQRVLPLDIQTAMNKAKDTNSYMAINQLMLRAMSKARYSSENLGHYALALNYYCHFTSPIRRYPDLMVHRILKTLLFKAVDFDFYIDKFEKTLNEISLYSSEREKASVDLEREVNDMLMAKYMENHLYEHYEGVIDSITGFGMFVMLDNGVEGLIHVSNLKEYYTFDEKLVRLQSNTKTFKIGDKVKVVVIEASKKDRKIDFMLESDYNLIYGE